MASEISKRVMESQKKNSKIVRLHKDTAHRLEAFKALHRLRSIDEAVQKLLEK